LSTTFEQPILPISDPKTYGAVRSAIEHAYSSANVANFLRSLERGKVRIRQFEQVLKQGLLGSSMAASYGKLPDVDQGQIREFYLASLERVAPELRTKFFKLYAYY
jgi:hypothetical protein